MSKTPTRPIRLIAGLGNPGSQYDQTRHNAGFWFCDQLAATLGCNFSLESRFFGEVAHARAQQLWLLKPQTFMNRSGQSIGALARFYRIEPDEILIVHDELDIPPGQLRLKFGGGLGGHNGLKDSSVHLGTHDYWRLRIGIGHPGDRNEVIHYVLKPPRREEQVLVDEAIERALGSWRELAAGEFTAAATRLNARPAKPKPARTPKAETQAADRPRPKPAPTGN